ncbi:MAG TPA: rRNA adenine N-6-methyltransferase family protein, partial [Gammaproteobacteria bacterium]
MTTHTPRKRFGQNFLHDTSVLHHIIDAIDPKKDDHLVEIGPGLGALTQLLINETDRL